MLEMITIEIEKLEKIELIIEKQKKLRIIGYLLIPIIVGFFIIKKSNENIYILIERIEKLTYIIIPKIEFSTQETENELKKIIDDNIYLIYPVRADLLNKLKNDRDILFNLRKRQGIFNESFIEFLDLSIDKTTYSINFVENFNKKLVIKTKKDYEFLFKKSTVELNDEQKTAIITDDKHNLIVAAAGSGKTEVLIIRIAYLVCREPKKILENRILVLAFQKKAAEEIEKRLTERFGINIKVKTFHSFGLEILKKVHLTRNIFNSTYNNRIKDLYERAEKDLSFQNKLIDYIKNFGDEEQLKQKSDFEKKEQWYCYMHNLRYTTLNGTQVKSEEEKAIMNFLLSHKINRKNIKILYEHPAKWMKYTDEKGDIIIPKPDFFLPDYDIYIEHWALNEKGRVPEWFKGNNPTKTYKRGMKAKIERFKQQKKYSLVETTSGEFKQKDFFENFKKKLIEEITNKNPEKKIYLSVMDYSELVKIVWKTCKESMNRNFLNVETFINKAKTNGLTPQNIQERLEKETWSPKQKAFAEIALVIYREYEKELHNANEIDFNDMINLALIELKNNKSLFENVFDHILIDEYQDISKQRCQLIKELMRKNNNCKLFCVGDDWQSIMGFTGSNLEFFVKFQNYFDHPARTDLTINYRSIKSIVDAGTESIKYNGDAQLKKITKAKRNEEKKITVYSSLNENIWMYYNQIAVHCINIVKEYLEKGYEPRDIMILYRIVKPPLINQIHEQIKKNNIPIKVNSRSPNSISLMTIHKSKGLQAKVVILLTADKGLYGFPCEIEDLLIFEPAMDTKYNNKEEEERRLFYVALTRSKEDIIIYTQKNAESMFLREIQKYTEIIDLD